MIKTRAETSPGLSTRILSVIIVIEHDIFIEIIFYGRKRVKIRRVSKQRRIMMKIV